MKSSQHSGRVWNLAMSRSAILECDRESILRERSSELILDNHEDAEKIELAIKRFQNVLQLNPNTFTKKQEAIFSLALKEALYEVMDVPHHHRNLEKEMVRIKRHDFWR
jgi:hypothetical protein